MQRDVEVVINIVLANVCGFLCTSTTVSYMYCVNEKSLAGKCLLNCHEEV